MAASPAAADRAPAEGPEARRCVRHPDRETLVSCGRCGRPFCPQCLIHTPAGQRCFECAGVRRDAPQRAAAAGVAKAFGVAALGSAIGASVGLLFLLIAALATGAIGGQMLAPSVNRKTRRVIYALGLLALVGGALVGSALAAWAPVLAAALPGSAKLALLVVVTIQVALSLQFWIFIAIAAAAGYQRVR